LFIIVVDVVDVALSAVEPDDVETSLPYHVWLTCHECPDRPPPMPCVEPFLPPVCRAAALPSTPGRQDRTVRYS
jgi:hypothetical protein